MGLKQSKPSFLSYDEVRERVKPEVEQRLRDAFKRYANSHMLLHKVYFFREVLGDIIPEKTGEQIYRALGGGVNGICYKDLVIGLVLLTEGTEDEKIKFLFSLFSNDSDYIEEKVMDQILIDIDGSSSKEVNKLFSGSSTVKEVSSKGSGCIRRSPPNKEKVTFEEFKQWIKSIVRGETFCDWVLHQGLELTDNVETKTFYSTLAGVTHLQPNDITQLEQRFWHLKEESGRIDRVIFKARVCGYLFPDHIFEGVFRAFDVNNDGQIDFKEMTCGVSACCRGPVAEIEKFCFKIFDPAGLGYLDEAAFRVMVEEFLRAKSVNVLPPEPRSLTEIVDKYVEKVFASGKIDKFSKGDYELWINEESALSAAFRDLLSQICHVVLGLPPESREVERNIVLHWLEREKRRPSTGNFEGGLLERDQRFYLISTVWWRRWLDFMFYEPKKIHRSNGNLFGDSSRVASPHVAGDWNGSVTGIQMRSFSMTNLCPNEGVSPSAETDFDAASRAAVAGGLRSSNSISFNREPTSRASPKERRQTNDLPKEPGPIDNSSLINPTKAPPNGFRLHSITDEGEIVRTQMRREEDFIVVSEKLWECLHRRYGGGPKLPRMAVAVPGSPTALELELHPIMVRLLKHHIVPEKTVVAGGGPQGRTAFINNFPNLMQSVGGLQNRPSGMGPVGTPRRKAVHLAFFSKVCKVGQIYAFLSRTLRIPREEMRLWLYVEEARMTLLEDEDMLFGRAAEQVNALHCLQNVVYDGLSAPLNLLMEVRNKDLTWPEEILDPTNKGLLQSRQAPPVPGVTGLNNLGNTCFLNAAVQCVSNTAALREYFKTKKFILDLNKTNPLGMQGKIAVEYGELVEDLWSGKSCAVAPLKLRSTIATKTNQFVGNLQHDAHEFLAFLLDGLHEDLNRVVRKPYVELKDSDGREDFIVAKEAWDNHLLRNESIVVKLFHGLLKSQVECASCSNVSVRFDPFSVLSLPLPMECNQPIDVIVSKMDDSQLIRYQLLLNHDDRFSDVKDGLARFYPGLSRHNILLAEVMNAQIRCFPRDGEKVNRMTMSSVFAYIFPVLNHSPAANAQNHVLHNGDSSASLADGTEMTSLPMAGVNTPPGLLRGNAPNSVQYIVGDNVCSFSCFIAYHRKMERNDIYFLAHMKARPSLFGLPIVVPYEEEMSMTGEMLYDNVWRQVSRCLAADIGTSANHATDGDNLKEKYPFQLKIVDKTGMKCSACRWFKICRGCLIACDSVRLAEYASLRRMEGHGGARYLAIDWEPTALHLRYQTSREHDYVVHESVGESQRRLTDPMDLRACLNHFISPEDLAEEDCYYCSKCEKHRRARKKLDVWKAPPILIVHLKRFIFVNNRWVKSNKIVHFPMTNFDLSEYVVGRRWRTISAAMMTDGPTPPSPSPPPSASSATPTPEDDVADDVLETGKIAMEIEVPGGDGEGSYKYDLYAIACHLGALGGGHYICYARNPNNKWYRYNDSSTKEIRVEEIDVDSAYILFYERKNLDYSSFMPKSSPMSAVPLENDSEGSQEARRCRLM